METTFTTEQVGALALIAGGSLVTLSFIALIFYILVVIADWKIFTKAGEKGWKSLIPIYNVYVLYRIIKVSFLKWLIIPAIVVGILSYLTTNVTTGVVSVVLGLVSLVIELAIYIKFCSALAKAFGKGAGFAVGLFFFPNIFQLILGFGSSKYAYKK